MPGWLSVDWWDGSLQWITVVEVLDDFFGSPVIEGLGAAFVAVGIVGLMLLVVRRAVVGRSSLSAELTSGVGDYDLSLVVDDPDGYGVVDGSRFWDGGVGEWLVRSDGSWVHQPDLLLSGRVYYDGSRLSDLESDGY